jgi:hypothetical protein
VTSAGTAGAALATCRDISSLEVSDAHVPYLIIIRMRPGTDLTGRRRAVSKQQVFEHALIFNPNISSLECPSIRDSKYSGLTVSRLELSTAVVLVIVGLAAPQEGAQPLTSLPAPLPLERRRSDQRRLGWRRVWRQPPTTVVEFTSPSIDPAQQDLFDIDRSGHSAVRLRLLFEHLQEVGVHPQNQPFGPHGIRGDGAFSTSARRVLARRFPFRILNHDDAESLT